MKKIYAILCLAIASLTQLQAQAPEGFNYQATVRNSSGDLIVNTNVYFKFNVIQGSLTAVPIFTETHYVPTDDLGQVNLVIGQGTANTGVFSELDWSLGSYYLGIELDTDTGNNYVAMGTTQLLSVPYALYAANSGNATPTTPNLEAVLAQNNSANDQQIKDLQDPTEAQDAVTKNYIYSKEEVDELISAFEDRINLLENVGGIGSVTDQDGNSYDYLTYGAQKWTVENAEMVTYRDGTPIPELLVQRSGATSPQALGLITTTTLQSQDFTIGMPSWVDNPDYDNTVNTSCKVGKVVKANNNPWDNNQYDLDAKLDFVANTGLKIKVWSARANTEVLLKLEEIGNAGNNVEKFLTTSVTSGWEELTFPFSAGDSGKFDRVVIFFDLNANNTDTYYFDDLKLYGNGSGGGGGGGGNVDGDISSNGGFETGDLEGWTLYDNGGKRYFGQYGSTNRRLVC